MVCLLPGKPRGAYSENARLRAFPYAPFSFGVATRHTALLDKPLLIRRVALPEPTEDLEAKSRVFAE